MREVGGGGWPLCASVIAMVAGCGAAAPATSQPPKPTKAQLEEQERIRRDALSAAHRERLDEQATALAATRDASQPAKPRCLPSCYVPEAADARAGKQVAGAAEITHLVCARTEAGPYRVMDALGTLAVRKARGRVPRASKPGSWQADVEAAVTTALGPEVARGDAVRVRGGWADQSHPVSREALRCVAVSHFLPRVRKAIDRCGSQGAVACEAGGSAAAHGINVVHYRLLEARQLERAGKSVECQQAALEAIAVARGMPRWRQYMTLNTDQWKAVPRYRTRFDGLLDEDALFVAAIALGVEAEAVYASCGGPSPKTDVAQEQSFHACW